QNGRFLGDADLERQKYSDLKLNGPQDHSHLLYSTIPRMQDPGQIVEETYTMEEDPEGAMSVVSVETSDDGTTRRTETTVKKVVKTMTTRTVQQVPVGPDGWLPLPPAPARGACPQLEPVALSEQLGQEGLSDQPGLVEGLKLVKTEGSGLKEPSLDGLPGHGASGTFTQEPNSQPAATLCHGTGWAALQQHPREPWLPPRASGLCKPLPRGCGVLCPSLSCLPESWGLPASHLGDQKVAERSLGWRQVHCWVQLRPGGPDRGLWAPAVPRQSWQRRGLDSLRKGGAGPGGWRQPELPEVIAMLSFRLDAVKSRAAAYLQHLCYRNDKVKTEVRKLKGIPVLVGLLDHPKKEVHYGACGALKNISFGKDQDNKIAIKNCDGVPALVRLLRKASDMDLTEVITGTLWNLSSHDSIKMAIVDHALHALTDEVVIPRSGWEREPNEDSKPRHIEWESVLTNTAGCLRNVSSERSEARRKLRECDGLVDALIYIVQSEIGQKDSDSKLVENCVCLLRNLSYQVHREIPHAERYQETPLAPANNAGPHAASCFGTKKGKDEWFSRGKKLPEEPGADAVDFPKRTTPAKGYELLFQPEVVRIYISLLKESKTPAILEASAGAIQNLCAGSWTYGRCIRSALRQEKGLSAIADLLSHDSERVVKAASGALRNLAVDTRNKELIGKHAIPNLVKNLPGGQQTPAKNLSEDTVVSVLNTINEVIVDNLEAAKKLRETQGIEKLVLINKSGNRSEREVRAAALVLQTVWGYKELRKPLEKEGWKKSDFQVNLSNASRTQGGNSFDDSTLPLIDRNQKSDKKSSREEIQMSNMGPVTVPSSAPDYSTLNERDHSRTLDRAGDLGEMEPVKAVPLMVSS
ncbi:Catenin delta-1, partial [Dryobates pubescens]